MEKLYCDNEQFQADLEILLEKHNLTSFIFCGSDGKTETVASGGQADKIKNSLCSLMMMELRMAEVLTLALMEFLQYQKNLKETGSAPSIH